jgi:hypothetical protein
MHPVELRENVTSPERDDDTGDPRARALRRACGVLNAITAATERSRELSERVSS